MSWCLVESHTLTRIKTSVLCLHLLDPHAQKSHLLTHCSIFGLSLSLPIAAAKTSKTAHLWSQPLQAWKSFLIPISELESYYLP